MGHYALFWMNLGSTTLQNNRQTAYYLPIAQTIQVRQTRHAQHHYWIRKVAYYFELILKVALNKITCWPSKDKFISDIFLWTPLHEHISVDWVTNTCIHQLFADTGSRLEDLPRANGNEWQERVNKILSWWHILMMMTIIQLTCSIWIMQCLSLTPLN